MAKVLVDVRELEKLEQARVRIHELFERLGHSTTEDTMAILAATDGIWQLANYKHPQLWEVEIGNGHGKQETYLVAAHEKEEAISKALAKTCLQRVKSATADELDFEVLLVGEFHG